MELEVEGKINFKKEIKNLKQAREILINTGLTPPELESLSIMIDGYIYNYDVNSGELTQARINDTIDDILQRMSKGLPGRTKDKPDW